MLNGSRSLISHFIENFFIVKFFILLCDMKFHKTFFQLTIILERIQDERNSSHWPEKAVPSKSEFTIKLFSVICKLKSYINYICKLISYINFFIFINP